MALTNSQHDYLMRIYEQRQLDNENELRKRFAEIYDKFPEVKSIDDSISNLSVEQAKKLLDGDDDALLALKQNLHLLFEQKRHILESAGYPSNYLELQYSCPDCKDTGYIGNQKCHCFKRAAIDYLYTQSNLKEILKKENFDTCSLDYYSSNHKDPLTGRSSLESMKTALKTCKDFAANFSDDFQNLLIYGDTGVGKTFLSHCVAKELLEKSYSVIYFTASGLFDILAKDRFQKDTDASMISDHILDCDLLIIDDLGTEFSNSFTTSQLFICLNERILRRKSTLISTNLALDDIRNIYSERVFSRITSAYTVLRITGDDIRIQKKLMNKTD